MINPIAWEHLTEGFQTSLPFNHIVIDDFFKPAIADQLEKEFPDFNQEAWRPYDNAIEKKKLLNRWDLFPATTYSAFAYLNSAEFLHHMESLTSIRALEPDYGLNGGGWHVHGRGGKLNVHLDYSLHPKLNKERRLNLIVYLSKNWESSWGGGLQLWSHNPETSRPLKSEKQIELKFNRAVIFDTTQNSWHGLPDEIACPEAVLRKSIAAYYLTPARENISKRGKALFAPTELQANDKDVLDLIERRSNVETAAQTYEKKK